MKIFLYVLGLLGLLTELLGMTSAAHLDPGDGDVDPITLHSTANTGGWPPFFPTSEPEKLCGDTPVHYKSTNKPPKASDCATLRDQLDAKPGFWNITADPGRNYGFTLVAGYKTCAFAMFPLDSSKDCLVGTEDARILLNDLVDSFAGYSIASTMGCTVNASADWVIMHT